MDFVREVSTLGKALSGALTATNPCRVFLSGAKSRALRQPGLWLVSGALCLALSAVPAEAAPFAYISNISSNTVSVIDIATNTVTTTVSVGGGPLGVAISPDRTRAYVTNQIDSTVSVIDTADNTVVATVPVGVSPMGVAVTPDGTLAYVASLGNDVTVIDTTTNTVTATVAVGGSSIGIAVSPDGSEAWVANPNLNTVTLIDTSTNTVAGTIAVGAPYGIALSPDGTRAYVADSGANAVSVIDTGSNTVIDNVAVGLVPAGIAVSPDGTRVYAANRFSNSVSVIDTATNNVIDTVSVGNFPMGLAVTPDGAAVYVANNSSDQVSVIGTATNSVSDNVTVGLAPYALGHFISSAAAAQTITFINPGARNFGTTPTLTATASSTLTVTFSSSTPGVCTITSGGALTFVTTGLCTIDAAQPGNIHYTSATAVSQTFPVSAVAPGAPTIGTATAGDGQASVSFTAPAFTGGAAVTGYTVASNPGGITATGAASPIVVAGLTNGVAYTFTVTATNSAGTGSASAASNSVTPAVASATQPDIATLVGGVTATLGVNGCTGIAGATFMAPPAGSRANFPFGLLDFTLTGCAMGGSATVTVTYSQNLPAGAVFYKYQNGAYAAYPATLGANSVSFTLTDNGAGDEDGVMNGSIDDPGGIGVPHGIPTLSEWSMLLLSLLLAGLTARRLRLRR